MKISVIFIDEISRKMMYIRYKAILYKFGAISRIQDSLDDKIEAMIRIDKIDNIMGNKLYKKVKLLIMIIENYENTLRRSGVYE